MAVSIDTPVQFLKGVGPKLGDVFRKRGISTVGELLEWFPRAYEDRRAARSIDSLVPGQMVSIKANVVHVRSFNLGRSRRKMYEIVVGDSTGKIACKYFRVPYRGYFDRFRPHQLVRIAGKVTDYRGKIEFHHPDVHPVGDDEENENALIPLYTETEGIRPAKLRKIIETAIDKLIINPEDLPETEYSHLSRAKEWRENFVKGVPEPFPQWLMEKYDLISRAQALRTIHQPPADAGDDFLQFKSPSQRRVIFEELFWLELHLALVKKGIKKEKAAVFSQELKKASELESSLPFQLTGAQKKSLEEIFEDLKAGHPMHRLVQGDVGSGKTLVALMAATHVADHGFQSSIMVPTEILAEQHYKNAVKLLEPLGLKVALLTGSTKTKEREIILQALQAGKIDLCVGTHALIQDDVEFQSLGLVIIDEQHRFGVDQRNKLKKKGYSPHFLVMTATPIPRTLAMTVYGDLDVSVIDELPPGRTPIVTRKVFDNKKPKVFQFMAEQIEKGRQAYIIYPLVEESENIDLKNAIEEHEKIKNQFPEFRVGLLHGKMKPKEKEQVMAQFRDHEIDILVSTTVIEVGVDVPNANMMIIEHAERFGLSQLHQLRGRVGRGQHKSYCVLVLGYATSDESRQRAEIMEKNSDGFKISEADLEMRGPGEFLGRRQSGLPGFKMANLVRDLNILKEVRKAAFELVDKDPELSRAENKIIRMYLKEARAAIVG